MIAYVHFKNFKALSDYSLSLQDLNILVGPNNSGKSTILDAFRILQAAYRYASNYTPKRVKLPNGNIEYGYKIPESSIPISLKNIQTNYTSEPAIIQFHFTSGQNLFLIFSEEELPILYFDTPRKLPKSLNDFKKEFKINISVLPTLGPFEPEEDVLNIDYVRRSSGGRRSSRMFRNIWYYFPQKFELFKELVEKTWPKMSICPPEKPDIFSKQLFMMCEENMIKREISWVGFGFQIWLQLLTHIVKSSESDIIVVDEPEIYLHPDLQYKILSLLKSQQSRVILATHSIEIINDAEPSEVVLIDKNTRNAKRINDLKGLQNVVNILGSGQNIHLTRLARSKKILFVEGDDLSLLKKLALAANFPELFTTGEITVIPINGFSQYEKVINANWAFSKVLGQELVLALLLDRDYRCSGQIEQLTNNIANNIKYLHILQRKEIENYLLVPQSISKAIQERVKSKVESDNDYIVNINAPSLLEEATNMLKTHTLSQITANIISYSKGKSVATIIKETSDIFEKTWNNLDERLKIVPGKAVLANLNTILQERHGVSITYSIIISKIRKSELDVDILNFFTTLESIRKISV